MAIVLPPRRLYSQPQGYVAQAHEWLRYGEVYYAGLTSQSASGRTSITQNTYGRLVTTPAGRAFRSIQQYSSGWVLGPASADFPVPVTWESGFIVVGGASTASFGQDTDYGPIAFSTTQIRMRWDATFVVSSSTFSDPIKPGECIFFSGKNNDYRIFFRGVWYANTGVRGHVTNSRSVGARHPSGSVALVARFPNLELKDEALIRDVCAYPWQLLRVESPRIYSLPASGGNEYSIAGDTQGEGVTEANIGVTTPVSIAALTEGDGLTSVNIGVTASYSIAALTEGDGFSSANIGLATSYSISALTEGDGFTSANILTSAAYSVSALTEGDGANAANIEIGSSYSIAALTEGSGFTAANIGVAVRYAISALTEGDGFSSANIGVAVRLSIQADTNAVGLTAADIATASTVGIAAVTSAVGYSSAEIMKGITWWRTGPNYATTFRAGRNIKFRR